MNKLIQFGLEEGIFSVDSLLDLFYGKVVTSTGINNDLIYQWIATSFEKIPEDERRDVIKTALEKAKQDINTRRRYEPFHQRAKCIWCTLLKRAHYNQNFSYMTMPYSPTDWRPLYIMTLEVLLWNKWSFPIGSEEEEYERQCWKKFTGDNKPYGRVATLELLRSNIDDMKPVMDRLEVQVTEMKEKLDWLEKQTSAGMKKEHQDVKKAFNRLLARQMENSASLAFMLAEYDAMTGNRIEL